VTVTDVPSPLGDRMADLSLLNNRSVWDLCKETQEFQGGYPASNKGFSNPIPPRW
jgi:hypothetical protein